VCNVAGVLNDFLCVATQPADFRKLYRKGKMDVKKQQIKLCMIELLSELKTYPENDGLIKLICLVTSYGNSSIAFVEEARLGTFSDDVHKKYLGAEQAFIRSSSEFIANQKLMLNKVIYGDLTLDQIKSIYYME
jgi:hypothetical protein